MGYSRQLYLSDCACLVEYKPSLIIGCVVNEGTSASGQVACGRSASLAEGIIGNQPDCTSPASLTPDPEHIGCPKPIKRCPFVVCGHPNAILHIVQMYDHALSPMKVIAKGPSAVANRQGI